MDVEDIQAILGGYVEKTSVDLWGLTPIGAVILKT